MDEAIEMVLQSCHTYDVESSFIRRFATREKELPYLNTETDYSQTDTGQVNTRLVAFWETIDK